MVAAYQGKNRVFKIGRTAGTLVDISTYAGGLANVDWGATVAQRRIPGGGSGDEVSYQKPAKIPRTISLTVDANTVTWPILWNWDGEELFFEDNPLGTESGTPKITGSMQLGPVPLPGPMDGEYVFSISGNINGAPTRVNNT